MGDTEWGAQSTIRLHTLLAYREWVVGEELAAYNHFQRLEIFRRLPGLDLSRRNLKEGIYR